MGWDVVDQLLPPESVVRHDKIYQSFRPLERQGHLTPEIAADKWAQTLDLICSYDINIDDLLNAFLQVAQIREGVCELFGYLEVEGVPGVVLSSGISNVIDTIIDHYGVTTSHVVSNTLTYDAVTRKVTGWDRDQLIHVLNKNERGSNELATLRAERPNVMLLGDVLSDVKMIDTDALRIRVLDPRKGEMHVLDEAILESFEAGYDLVTEHSLQPAVGIARYIVSSQRKTI